MRISRIRLSDGRRLQTHADRAARTASPEAQACSGVASSSSGGGFRLLLEEVLGLRHSPDRCPLHKHTRSQAPSLHRRYPASRVLRACLPPHTARPACVPRTGRRDRWMHALLSFSSDGGQPRSSDGSAPALPFSRPAQRSLTFRPAYSPSRLATLYTGGFSDFVTYVPAPIATDLPAEHPAQAGRSNPCRVGTFTH